MPVRGAGNFATLIIYRFLSVFPLLLASLFFVDPLNLSVVLDAEGAIVRNNIIRLLKENHKFEFGLWSSYYLYLRRAHLIWKTEEGYGCK